MSASSDQIDLSKLERELVGALEADRKYSRENDAKFRAVNQRVATYEEFREIVNASHLTPLERKDLTDSTRTQPWNSVAAHSGTGGRGDTQDPVSVPSTVTQRHPSNVQEFLRRWKQMKTAERYRFLLDIGGDSLYTLFKIDISMGLLGEMLQVLKDEYSAADSEQILCILRALSQSSRFSLSVTFLSQTEKQTVTELFQELSKAEYISKEIIDIARLYSVQTQLASAD